MEFQEMKEMVEEALAIENIFKRDLAYAKVIVKLGPIEELEMAQAIVDARDDLRNKVAKKKFNDIEHEIKLRHKWMSKILSLNQALLSCSHVAKRTKGIGYKIALLEFSEFCSCEVTYTCKILEEIIAEFELGVNEVRRDCGTYASGQWPLNHYPSVLAAMALFTQRPCWVLRHLFLLEIKNSGICNFETIYFERE